MIYIATIETRHYTFTGYGRDAEQAQDALLRALRRHGRQVGLPRNWADPYLDDIQTKAVTSGRGYRDDILLA